MSGDALQDLLDRYFERLLTAEECLELQRSLLLTARARERFWEAARWHALFMSWGSSKL